MTTRDVVFIDAGQPRTLLATPDAPHTHLPPFWATAAFDSGHCRVRQPTAPVRLRDINTSAEITVAPTLIDDMPPPDPEIVYRATFSDTDHLTGRLVPVRTLESAESPSSAAFAPRSDADALFLMRYMPASRAALIAMQGADIIGCVGELMRIAPGMLVVLGYVDVQGARQAYRDFQAESPYAAASVDWWRQLLAKARVLQNACSSRNIHLLRNDASLEQLFAALQDSSFQLMSNEAPNGALWTRFAALLCTKICQYFADNGRVGGHTQSFVDALRAYDMMFWRGTAAPIRTNAAGWIEPPKSMHDIGLHVHAAIEQLPKALPVVVFANAEQWKPYELSYALATLLLAVPKQAGPDGKYALTGSAVPVKIVVLFNTDSYAGLHPQLTPQHKL